MRRFILLLILLTASPLWADSLSIQQGVGQYGPCSWGNLNKANANTQDVGAEISVLNSATSNWVRFLLRLDSLSYIPALSGATVDSARLWIYKFNAYASASTVVTPYAVLAPWTYYVGAGYSPTWNRQGYNNSAPDTNWTNAGCDTSTSASVTAAATGQTFSGYGAEWRSWKITSSIVSGWITAPSSNQGLIFRSTENAAGGSPRFRSPSSTTASEHPKLTIYYTAGGGSPANSKYRRREIIIKSQEKR